MEDVMNEAQILDEVLFNWFPNATTEEELQDELDCISLERI